MIRSTLCLLLLLPLWTVAQNLPLSRDLQVEYQLKNPQPLPLSVTAMAPWIVKVPDSLTKTSGSWLGRKLFREHLLGINEGDVKITADPLVNFQGGYERYAGKGTFTNTRGFLIKGVIGPKVSFESTLQENQASLSPYLDRFAHQNHIIPGSGRLHGYFGGTVFDYNMATAYLDFNASKHFDFQLGNGKNFIGEGYRSMILSDESFAYPYLRVTTTLGPFKYTNLYAQFQDLSKYEVDTNYFRKKFTTMHLLSWDVTSNFNLSFFEAIVWSPKDSARRGFEVSYLNPVILLRPVEFGLGSPDNTMMAFMGSYRWGRTTFYAQAMLDEFKIKDVLAGNGLWANKQALQFGAKSLEPFNIKGLFVRAEYNRARPYTYSHDNSLTNWGNYNQPLAHPLGANFKEGLIEARYQTGRWIGSLTAISAMYGLDDGNLNNGGDIFKSYNTFYRFFGNTTGQGLRTHLLYTELECRYVINPAIHLEAVGRMVYRDEHNAKWSRKDNEFALGLRTSIFNRYGAF